MADTAQALAHHITALEELRGWLRETRDWNAERRVLLERADADAKTKHEVEVVLATYERRADALSAALSLLAEREWRPITDAQTYEESRNDRPRRTLPMSQIICWMFGHRWHVWAISSFSTHSYCTRCDKFKKVRHI